MTPTDFHPNWSVVAARQDSAVPETLDSQAPRHPLKGLDHETALANN